MIDQFRAFQTPLLYIKLYAEEHREEIEEMEEKARLREMLRLVQTRIDDMLEELDKFQEHLAVDVRIPLKRQPKAIATKIRFSLFKSNDIAKWESSLSLHASSLQLMLIVMFM